MNKPRSKVFVVLGTRPEAIKQAPVLWALNARPHDFEAVVVNTGQHRELLNPILALLGIEPRVNLDVLRPDQPLAGLNARCLTAMDDALVEHRPGAVLVQGDTTTAVAAATAAFYRRIPVGHVEAGLRSHSLSEPFPEEVNRIWIDSIARWRWAPTEGAAACLRAEGLHDEGTSVTGNTVVDALRVLRARLERDHAPVPGVPACALADGRPLVLVTCHRRESFGDGVRSILRAFARLAARYPAVSFVYPVHMNPNVRAPTYEALGGLANVFLVDPLPYDAMVRLLGRARLVLTDSGGIQEEAPSMGVPALVLRNRTERPEGVAAGCVALVGTDEEAIVASTSRLLDDPAEHARMARVTNPYGDGCAAERIVHTLARDLRESAATLV